MHALILAGGEGSRLVADGIAEPKAFVQIGGRAQLVRLAATFLELGCPTVTCMLRDDVAIADPPPWRNLPAHQLAVHRCRTPSSLHTLVAGLARVPQGPVLCAMVDTIMPDAEWRRVYSGMRAALNRRADAALLTTPYYQDDHPLYVTQDETGRVRAVGTVPADPVRVTGGAYAFAPRTRQIAVETLAQGYERMRAFLGVLVQTHDVVAVEAAQVIDLDRGYDLAAANAWLNPADAAHPKAIRL